MTVLLTSPAQVEVSCGVSNETTSIPAGLSKIRLPLVEACSVVVDVSRANISVLHFAPVGFDFQLNPPSYNFNAFVAASP